MAKILVNPTKENIDFIVFNIIYEKQSKVFDKEKKLDWDFTSDDLLKELNNYRIFCYSKDELEKVIEEMYAKGQLSTKYDNTRNCIVYHFSGF